ncbi:MAG: FHA domain-containing protein, partial [Bacteriovoracaceae bacterium]|nr:FHA domain-containing protein [Bacteriovoracaceae bacterium]
MHLKIEANGEEQIFVFKNKSAVTIGRSQDCDISLGYEGVSRVHLQVHERNGEYFVEDLGATNGTFINDQPLRPKELAPFNSFFPIKLGHSVYLYLLDEVSAEQMNEEALAQQELEALKMREEQKKLRQEKLKKERVYVPKSQGKVKVEDLSGTHKIKRKKIAVGTKQRPVRKDKFFLKALIVLGLVIVAGFAAKNVILKKLKGSDTTIAEGVKKVPIKKAPAPVKEFDEQRGDGIVNLDKCFGEKEGILCKALTKKRERSNREGFVQLLTNMYLAVDINSLIDGLGSNYKYTETEIEEVENAMKLRLGRAFSGIE